MTAVFDCFPLLSAAIALPIAYATREPLSVGRAPPQFVLPDETGTEHRLTDYRGQWVLLYFYPKDDTPGCTREACQFRDHMVDLKHAGLVVFGVSLDDRARHARFSRKLALPFPLLSDIGGEVARAYGALAGFGPVRFARRQSFLIAPDGTLAKIYRKVNPDRHTDEVLQDLTQLISAEQSRSSQSDTSEARNGQSTD